jgi:hypothetical protein
MNEQHFKEIEATLLYISEARQRAEKGIKNLTKLGAKDHLVDSLRHSEVQLRELHRSLMHGTYFSDETYDDGQAEPAADQMTLS